MGEGWVGLGIYRQTDGRGVGWTWNLQTDRWKRGVLDLEVTGRQQGWTATGLGFGRQTERHLCRTWILQIDRQMREGWVGLGIYRQTDERGVGRTWDLQTERWERGGLDLGFTDRQMREGWVGLGIYRQTDE